MSLWSNNIGCHNLHTLYFTKVILNAAAMLTSGAWKFNHVTPTPPTLQSQQNTDCQYTKESFLWWPWLLYKCLHILADDCAVGVALVLGWPQLYPGTKQFIVGRGMLGGLTARRFAIFAEWYVGSWCAARGPSKDVEDVILLAAVGVHTLHLQWH